MNTQQPGPSKVVLRGFKELTPQECKEALGEAMTIIEAVGTTGIYHKLKKAQDWMEKYYPSFV